MPNVHIDTLLGCLVSTPKSQPTERIGFAQLSPRSVKGYVAARQKIFYFPAQALAEVINELSQTVLASL
jgi:hypothetical protein